MDKETKGVRVKQESRDVVITSSQVRKPQDGDAGRGMVHWNPAPDASPPASPSDSKTFTVSN